MSDEVLARDGALLGSLTRIFEEAVQSFYALRAQQQGQLGAKTGSLAVLQRTSADLRLNPHVYAVFLDGACSAVSPRVSLHPATIPSDTLTCSGPQARGDRGSCREPNKPIPPLPIGHPPSSAGRRSATTMPEPPDWVPARTRARPDAAPALRSQPDPAAPRPRVPSRREAAIEPPERGLPYPSSAPETLAGAARRVGSPPSSLTRNAVRNTYALIAFHLALPRLALVQHRAPRTLSRLLVTAGSFAGLIRSWDDPPTRRVAPSTPRAHPRQPPPTRLCSRIPTAHLRQRDCWCELPRCHTADHQPCVAAP